jgi:hypothetical protein
MIYSWISLNREQPVNLLCECTSKMISPNDNCFYFSQIKKDPATKKCKSQKIFKVDVIFSTFDLIILYNDINTKEKLKIFNIDIEENKMFLLYKTNVSQGSASLKNIFSFKFFDLNENKMTYELDISNMELIGRLLSGLYTFVKGHIYFNNNVIKIRYDLFLRDIVPNENEVFD